MENLFYVNKSYLKYFDLQGFHQLHWKGGFLNVYLGELYAAFPKIFGVWSTGNGKAAGGKGGKAQGSDKKAPGENRKS